MAHPTAYELEEIARQHLSYEIDRLLAWSTVQLPHDAFTGSRERGHVLAKLVARTTLESALLHLRNVAKFLTTTKANAHLHDVVAAHYFERSVGWRPPPFVLGTNQDEHDEILAEIDKRLVHLTTRRVGIEPFERSGCRSRRALTITIGSRRRSTAQPRWRRAPGTT